MKNDLCRFPCLSFLRDGEGREGEEPLIVKWQWADGNICFRLTTHTLQQ